MQEGQNRKTSSLSILAIAGVEPYQEKPGEEYMNEAQLAHFRRILEAWRNQLRDEVDRTVTHMQDEAAKRWLKFAKNRWLANYSRSITFTTGGKCSRLIFCSKR